MDNLALDLDKVVVSVIIPTRNRCLLLPRAIESVLNQSHKDIELIVVDDDSEDSTSQVVNNYRERAKDLKYIRNDKPYGGAKSRNIGIANASGKYMAFLDDDDEWLPQKIESQLNFLYAHPDIMAVSCWYIKDTEGKRRKVKKYDNLSFETMLWENFFGSFSFSMVRAEIFKKVGPLDDTLGSCHDWEFWIRVCKSYKVGVVNEFLAIYYKHSENISNLTPKALSNYVKVYERNKNFMSKSCKRHHIKKQIISSSKLIRGTKERLGSFARSLKEKDITYKQNLFFILYGFMNLWLENSFLKELMKSLKEAFQKPCYIEFKNIYQRHMDRPNKSKIGICMILGAYYPEIAGSAIQCFNLIDSLEGDFDFYVIATSRTSFKAYRTKQLFTEEILGKAKVFRINVYPREIISEILSLLTFFVIFFKIKNKIHIFHMHGYTRKSYLITILAKVYRKRTIVKTTSFGIDDPLSIRKRTAIVSVFYSRIDAYVVTSPAQKASFKILGLPEHKISMIPNGVNLNRFNIPSVCEKSFLRQQMGIPDSSDVILSVSFFSRDKGIDIFAESLLLLPQDILRNIFLIFVGSRSNQHLEVDNKVVEKVSDIIKRLNIKSRCLFIDSTHDIDKYFKVSDIFILPSKREGLPNALLEAMACGLCCIANRLEGTTTYLIDSGKDGYLLDVLSPNYIAEIFKKTVGNKELQSSLGNKAHLKIRRDFNMDEVKERYTNLYSELLERDN